MSAAASNANAQGKRKGFLSGLTSGGGAGRTVFIAATATGVMAVGVTAAILGNAADTGTYYVLSADVAARTPITPDMLKPVTTSAEGVPRSAYDPVDLQRMEVFAKISLKANEMVTASNTGALEAINKDLPAGFVVASLSASAENAVAGKIRGGQYIDVYAVGGEGSAAAASGGGAISKLVLHHMLVLDVTVSPSTITQAAGDVQTGANVAPGPESAAARGGIPALYTVAVTPQDAAKIALIRDKNVFLTLSSNEGGKAPMNVQQRLPDMFAPTAVGDSGAGTAAAVKAAAAVTPTPTPTATEAATS
jgi:Flp pilus assembly protein CpaB